MRLISENALNDSIDKWFSPGPWAHCAYFSWPGLGCQLLIVTKAIDCDLWDPTFRDSCKLQTQCCCATLTTRPPPEYSPEYWMLIFLFCSSSRWYCPCSGTETGPHYPVVTPCLSSHSVIHTGQSHLSEISRIFSFAVIDTSVVR